MSIKKNEVMKMEEEKKEIEIKEEESDAQEVREVMEALKDTVPALIKGIIDALYSAQSAEDFGKQVAGFYKSMIDAGMTNEQAFELTKEFMESRDIVGVLKKILSEGDWKEWAKKGKEVTEEEVETGEE